MRMMILTPTRAPWMPILVGSLLTLISSFSAVQAQQVDQHSAKAQEPSTETRQAEAKQWVEPEYIRWLEERSMLFQAARASQPVSGQGVQWRHPYAEPEPRKVVGSASVWVLGYPGSVITRDGESVIEAWASPELWEAFRNIGIELLHTGPVKRSGGIKGKTYTPTVDGWFDRIALDIDPELGTEEEYLRMVAVARNAGGQIAGDLVPLHTGLGADFHLATRAYRDYPGMYTMVEIPQDQWTLLPEISDPWATAPVSMESIKELADARLVPGPINVADATPNARSLSGWDATPPVLGVDGKTRRWIYLHYFKPGQPTLNWLDPSLAGPRAIFGDLTKTFHHLGTSGVRLDAVPFMGIERQPGFQTTLHYQHPLSIEGTRLLAMYTRKLGGWSFQELNVPLEQLKVFMRHGSDLSYDFFTRAQVVHSLLIADASLLRQAYHFLRDADVELVSLVHDLQNHDEITYQLVELDSRGDDTLTINGEQVLGRQLRQRVLQRMRDQAAGESAPYNHLYRAERDGLATTYAGFIAASLDIADPYHATPEEVDRIKRAHLLLAMATAMQPGVFSLSGWDLVGALPLPLESVAERADDGDYRWVNRGGVDLMNVAPQADRSAFGLPRATALYGSIPRTTRRSRVLCFTAQGDADRPPRRGTAPRRTRGGPRASPFQSLPPLAPSTRPPAARR